MNGPGSASGERRRTQFEGGPATTSAPVPSPCVNVCRMDAAGQFCEGCRRTLAEIAAWASMMDAARREVWRQLPQRRAAAALASPQLPEERP